LLKHPTENDEGFGAFAESIIANGRLADDGLDPKFAFFLDYE
jgi:hypothetical protein